MLWLWGGSHVPTTTRTSNPIFSWGPEKKNVRNPRLGVILQGPSLLPTREPKSSVPAVGLLAISLLSTLRRNPPEKWPLLENRLPGQIVRFYVGEQEGG